MNGIVYDNILRKIFREKKNKRANSIEGKEPIKSFSLAAKKKIFFPNYTFFLVRFPAKLCMF